MGDPQTYELTNLASKVHPSIAATLTAYVSTFEGCQGDTCRAAEAVAPPLLLTANFSVSPATPTSSAPVTLTASASGTSPYTFTWTIDSSYVYHSTDRIETSLIEFEGKKLGRRVEGSSVKGSFERLYLLTGGIALPKIPEGLMTKRSISSSKRTSSTGATRSVSAT